MSNRASQFLPFASLPGFDEYLRKKRALKEERRALSEDDASELSFRLAQVRRGQMITVVYYDTDHYASMTGMVSHIDTAEAELTLVKTRIPFSDLLYLGGEDIQEKREMSTGPAEKSGNL